jgi:uncharacterized protein YbjT (DUF2867 family)
MIRRQDQCPFFEELGVEAIVGDLEGEFAHAFEGCDRVVFTAGSGGHTGGDKTLLVDLYGAIRAIEESERRRLEHFIMVSSMRADRPLEAPPAMRHYVVAKKLADERLLASSVPSTILRPGRLSDAPGSGCVRPPGAGESGAGVSRENVAECIAAALEEPAARGRVVELLDGDLPIAQLFAASS